MITGNCFVNSQKAFWSNLSQTERVRESTNSTVHITDLNYLNRLIDWLLLLHYTSHMAEIKSAIKVLLQTGFARDTFVARIECN